MRLRWFVMLSGSLIVRVTRGLPFLMVYKHGLLRHTRNTLRNGVES
jgi:hypothetical protein